MPLYLYAVTTPAADGFVHDGMGADTQATARRVGDFVVVAEPADADVWTGSGSAARLERIEWVAPRAVHHEAVVEAVMQRAPVYPARFGTLFSSEARLAATLAAHAEALTVFLARVATASEWGVQALLDRARAEQHRAGTADAAPPASGAAYLRRRKAQQAARAGLGAWAEARAGAALNALARHAAATQPLPVRPDPSLDGEVVRNAAFLVDDAALDAFRAAVERRSAAHADAGLTLRLTGPWPPYTFRPAMDGDATGGA
jgi:hypothetical protein